MTIKLIQYNLYDINQSSVLTLSDGDVNGVDDGVDDVKDDVGVDDAANILLASRKMFGRLTNQLQISNWFVISLNWGGILSSSIDRNKVIFII
jgi:hypothetical protein